MFHPLFKIEFMQKIIRESLLSGHLKLFQHNQGNEGIHACTYNES